MLELIQKETKLKSELKVALDSQDADQIMEAQDKLTKLAVEKEKVSMTLADKESKNKEVESQPAEQAQNKLQHHKLAQGLKNGLLIMNGLDLTEY